MRNIPKFFSNISVGLLIIAAVLLLPVITIILGIFKFNLNVFIELFGNVFLQYIINTIYLIILVIIFSLVIAIVSAFLLARFDFKFKKVFNLVLILPLSIPAYIMGFAYVMLFEYKGVLDNLFGLSANIFNIYWVALILALSLFPYLFVMVKAVFVNILGNIAEEVSNLKIKESRLLFIAMLPMAKVTILFALGLIIMESLNEYGLVAYFGINTITILIFKAIYGFNNLNLAVFISASIAIVIFIILLLFKAFKGKQVASFKINSNIRSKATIKPSRIQLLLIYVWLSSVFLAAFAIPVGVLLYKASIFINIITITDFKYLFNSLLLSLIVAIFSVVIAFTIVYLKRYNYFVNVTLARLPILGYAIPGAIIGMGTLMLLQYNNIFFTLLKYSGLGILVYAYLVRFVFIPINSIENIYLKYTNIEESIVSLKKRDLKSVFIIDFVIVKKALILGFLLVFLDSMKELPIALLLRPLRFETITLKTWYLANNEMLSQTSVYALMLIICSSIIVWIFSR